MKIVTIEPTPSPNSMKVVVDEELPFGKSYNYTKENMNEAPSEIQAILNIEGVKGVYRVADFLAVERNAKYQWEHILSRVRNALGEKTEQVEQVEQAADQFGEVFVHVQMFRGLPLQIKVFDSTSQHRISTGERFIKAFNSIQIDKTDENYIFERKWADFGIRYGEKEEIAES
ncbi:MAG: virulence factor, partial [Lysinibacillus sp.]|nr:virulence factor [Lysinibacillus sp.]